MVQTISDELVVGRNRIRETIGRKNIGGVLVITGQNSDSYQTCQDGNGRIQRKWNASYGLNERYLVSNEAAYFENIRVVQDPYYSIQYAPPGIAGRSIPWRNHFSISSTGNIGVNQQSPTERLEVVGNIKCQKLICQEIVGPASTPSGEDSVSIYQQSRDAVVSMLVRKGTDFFTGTGFFVSPDGWIVTAGHNFILENVLQKMDQVFVTITNFNGGTQIRIVECSEFYVDGAGDIGVARVPGLTNQAYLEWGSASSVKAGEPGYVIGDPLGNDIQSISKGIVRDNHFVDPNGYALLTNILVDAPAFAGNSGSPIINQSGNVIGIYTFGFVGTESFGGGPSQVVAQPVAEIMMTSRQDYSAKRYLGISWGVFDTLLAIQRLGVGFTSFDLRGVMIYVKESDSPLTGLRVGDVLLTINGVELGNRADQFSPTHITWLIQSTSTVSIQYIRPPSTQVLQASISLNRNFSDHKTVDGPLLGNTSTDKKRIKLMAPQKIEG